MGKRAVTLSLDDHSGLERILYPGCIVDVVASFKVNASEEMGRAVSTTLLQNIEVLAVEGSSVVNKEDPDKVEARTTRTGTRRSLLVTVMVDSKQAEALQLATQHGEVSLAMRNPADVAVANSDATLLAEGQLAQLAQLLAPKVGGQGDRFEEESGLQSATADGSAPVATAAATAAPEAPQQQLAAIEPSEKKGASPWGIEVFRAMSKETTFIPVQN
jgi:Flp pilus assembly protein CpaB